VTITLAGHSVQFRFPVRLSELARRQALMATGERPDSIQYVDVEDLPGLDGHQRERVVDAWERIEIAEEPASGPRVTRYEWLRYAESRGWQVSGRHGETFPFDEAFFAAPGRTCALYGQLRDELQDPAPLDAMLGSAPLLDELGEQAGLSLDGVLRAYDRAFAIARRARDRALQGRRADEVWAPAISSADDLVVVRPGRDREEAFTIGLVRESDPKAFSEAERLVREVQEAGDAQLTAQFANDVCSSAFAWGPEIESDRDVVEHAIRPAAAKIREELNRRQHKARGDREYEEERKQWIAQHGSQRLKLAAARGYRHDGAYRDERLGDDLPGFVGSLGKKPEIREVINPTDKALQVETEVLERIARGDIGELEARLVWVQDRDFGGAPEGEYVEVKGYLGRHTVYRPVDPDAKRDDIPF
jgi:hypothetical protein